MKQFVYSFLLVVVALCGAPALLSAQCTPLDTIPGDAIIDPLPFTEENPENGIRDTACVGEDFVTVFNIEVPDTVTLGIFGDLPIDSAIVSESGITGLPGGLDFTINPSNRVFYPNTTGCLQIAGAADAGTEGIYNLEIEVTIFSGPFFSQTFTLPDNTLAPGEYRLYVRPNGDPSCVPNAINESVSVDFSLNVFPNPANESANVRIDATKNGAAQLRVINVAGQVVAQQSVQLINGENRFSLPTAKLAPGFYTVLLAGNSGGLRNGVSRRLVVIH